MAMSWYAPRRYWAPRSTPSRRNPTVVRTAPLGGVRDVRPGLEPEHIGCREQVPHQQPVGGGPDAGPAVLRLQADADVPALGLSVGSVLARSPGHHPREVATGRIRRGDHDQQQVGQAGMGEGPRQPAGLLGTEVVELAALRGVLTPSRKVPDQVRGDRREAHVHGRIVPQPACPRRWLASPPSRPLTTGMAWVRHAVGQQNVNSSVAGWSARPHTISIRLGADVAGQVGPGRRADRA